MKDIIKLYVCCHKAGSWITPPLGEYIQCGAAKNARIPGILHDDDGVNISEKNPEYCELTAHYYAWKNVRADYYGFCHYRRFFGMNESRYPYISVGRAEGCKKYLGTEAEWIRLISNNEIIAPYAEDMGSTVRDHYEGSAHHYTKDLDLFLGIIKELHPDFSRYADEYLEQDKQYFCNMFIMDRTHFMEYCEMLFSVLDEFDRKKKLHGSFQDDRTDGYLGELFTGMYICFCRANGARVSEVARIDTDCPMKKRMLFHLLPPESKRRFWVKRVVKKIWGNKNV